MATAADVAKYFLSLSDVEAGDTISNLKLQKLLYYAQGFHAALFGDALFPERIEAWTHGPVVPDVYHSYKAHGSEAIPPSAEFDVDVMDDQTRDLLDEVYSVYGQYSAWKLRNMTHVEAPWADAYARAPSSQIELGALSAYFRTLTQ